MREDLGQSVEYGFLSQLVASSDGAVVVDVGAEKGSVVALAVAAGARTVHAFEPLERHFEELRRRFRDDRRVTPHRHAISDRSGAATLRVATDDQGRILDHHHSLTPVAGARRLRFDLTEAVETLSVEDAAERFGFADRIDLLKIDTEGHDLAVLGGLGRQRPRVIACEFWGHLPDTSGLCPYRLEELVDRGRDLGYEDCLAISHVDGFSWLDVNPRWLLSDRQWGNLFLVRADAWPAVVAGPLAGTLAALNAACLASHVEAVRTLQEKEAVLKELAAAAEERLELIHRLAGTATLEAGKGG